MDSAESKKIRNRTQSSVPGQPHIPVFFLYGEPEAREADDFVHLEDIRTRSERYAWRIGSHRHHGLFQVLFVRKGEVALHLDGAAETLSGPCVVTVPASTVHDFRFSPGTDGQVLTIAETLLAARRDGAPSHLEGLLAAPRATDLSSEPQTAQRIATFLGEITSEFRDGGPGSAELQGWLAASLLLLIARAQASQLHMEQAERPGLELFARFRALVETHYLEHRPVPFYAQALGVTPSRLDRTCRAVANRSAFQITQDRLVLEARRKLTYIAAPVSLLAYELGFEDPAYFWRFFRRRTGLTPNAFRLRAPAKARLAAAPHPP